MVRIRRVSTFHRVCCVSCVSVGARVSVCLVACGGGPVESAIRDPCSYAGCVCIGCARAAGCIHGSIDGYSRATGPRVQG